METILLHKLNEEGIFVSHIDELLLQIETNNYSTVFERGKLPLSYSKKAKDLNLLYINSYLLTQQCSDDTSLSIWYEAPSEVVYDKTTGEAILLANTQYIAERTVVLKKDVLSEAIEILSKELFEYCLYAVLKKRLLQYTPKFIDRQILAKKIVIHHSNTISRLRNKLFQLMGTKNYRVFLQGMPIRCNPALYRIRFLKVDPCNYVVYNINSQQFNKVTYKLTKEDVIQTSDIYRRFLKEVIK